MDQTQPILIMHQVQSPPYFMIPIGFIIIALLAVGWLFVGSAICRYTGLLRGKSALLWLLACFLSMAFLIYPQTFGGGSGPMHPFFYQAIFAIPLPLLALPFIVRLYRKWIGGHLTEAEKLPGAASVRAWLGVGNVICAVLIPICVWQVLGYSPLAILALTFGLLLAYPLLNLASQSAQPAPVGATEDLSKEREKVLQLLEAGKINATDSAELLNALAQSTPPSAPKSAAKINPQRKLVLVGAAVLLAGFFLPWFSINPHTMMNAMDAVVQSMGGMIPANVMPLHLDDGTVQIHAGDLAHGLGWWILALGITAAVLPFFATTLESSVQKKIILAALGIGAILLIYLLSDTLRYVSLGILLALAGYVLEAVGTLKERPAAR